MFKKNHPSYFFTSDKTRIFYNTNFNQRDFNPKKLLLIFNYVLVCSNFHWTYQIPYFDNKNYQILIHDYRNHFTSSGEKGLSGCNLTQIDPLPDDFPIIIEVILIIYNSNPDIYPGQLSKSINIAKFT